MIRFLSVAIIAAALVAQQSPKPKQQHKTEQRKAPDPEDRWICRIGSYHDCHCPAMMAEAQDAWVKKCLGEKDYAACMKKEPSNCDTIQKADTKHAEHSCKRTCKAIAGCQCDDGPVCKGPLVNRPSQRSDENQ